MESFNIKKVAITGATGMIGSTLISKLISEGIELIAIVRPNSLKLGNVPNNKLIEFIECQLNDLQKLKSIEKKCDVFFHFAWDGTFGNSRNELYLQNNNIAYTLDAVNLAQAWGCHTFIGAGSQAEYGRVSGTLSGLTPVNPDNGYGLGKYAAGKMSAYLAEQLGMRHMWGRILSTYGPMDNSYTVIMSTIEKLLNNKCPELTAGEQMWDYLYSEDAANAFFLMAKHGKNQSTYCIGGGSERPLKEYFTILRDAIDPNLPLGLGEIPYPKQQVMKLCADLTDLKEDTGFIPQISFDVGIRRTIEWAKEQRRNEKS